MALESSFSDTPVVVLAGGLGTRLGSLTDDLPKAMIEVAGKPFLLHQLNQLRLHGLRRIVCCIGIHGELIREVVGDGTNQGLAVEYVADGPVLLGTGGALKLAASKLGDLFFVIHGDAYLQCDYRHIWEAFVNSHDHALMTVFRNDDRWDRSNVLFDDGKIIEYDKIHPSPNMKHIDYGLAVMRRQALDLIPADRPYDLTHLYRKLLSIGQLGAYEVRNRFYEIGSLAGLQETREFLALQARDGTQTMRARGVDE
jgi:NDP-sugar pyrophosphorylase family protein